MTTFSRRILLALLTLLGASVGGWALFAPQAFYDSFPGLGFGAWVGEDGAFNEHLIRDVGELYLGLAGAGVVAMLTRKPTVAVATSRVAAVAWLVFSIPHLLYHLEHLGGMTLKDAVGEPVSLALSIVLSAPLLVPDRRKRSIPAAAIHDRIDTKESR